MNYSVTTSTEAKRLQYVDAIKGIAILCVVVYHLLAPCAVKTVIDHLTELFLMVFFFYSGFFYKPGRRSLGENIRNRAKALLAPFFKYSLGFWAAGSVYLVATGSETVKEALLCLRNFYAGCIWNRTIQNWFGWEYHSLGKRYFFLADFWFLIAMLFASIFFFLLVDRVLRSGKTAIPTAAALFAVTGLCLRFSVVLPYNLHLVPYWTAFMLLGAYAGTWMQTGFPALPAKAKWPLGILLPVIGIVIAMLKAPSVNQFRGSFGENELRSMLLCIAAAAPFTWGIGMLFFLLEGKGVRMKEAAWLGFHSLIVYLFHMFYAWILCILTGFSISYKEPVSPGVLAGSVLLTAVSIGLCILHNILKDKLKK